jgi:hypothetical protein
MINEVEAEMIHRFEQRVMKVFFFPFICNVFNDAVNSLPCVEAGQNTSTAALRVAEGDEKGTRCNPVTGKGKANPVTDREGP